MWGRGGAAKPGGSLLHFLFMCWLLGTAIGLAVPKLATTYGLYSFSTINKVTTVSALSGEQAFWADPNNVDLGTFQVGTPRTVIKALELWNNTYRYMDIQVTLVQDSPLLTDVSVELIYPDDGSSVAYLEPYWYVEVRITATGASSGQMNGTLQITGMNGFLTYPVGASAEVVTGPEPLSVGPGGTPACDTAAPACEQSPDGESQGGLLPESPDAVTPEAEPLPPSSDHADAPVDSPADEALDPGPDPDAEPAAGPSQTPGDFSGDEVLTTFSGSQLTDNTPRE